MGSLFLKSVGMTGICIFNFFKILFRNTANHVGEYSEYRRRDRKQGKVNSRMQMLREEGKHNTSKTLVERGSDKSQMSVTSQWTNCRMQGMMKKIFTVHLVKYTKKFDHNAAERIFSSEHQALSRANSSAITTAGKYIRQCEVRCNIIWIVTL